MKIPRTQTRTQFAGYHNRSQRWAIVVAHRRAGKTYEALLDLVERAGKFEGADGRFAYVAQYKAHGQLIARRMLVKMGATPVDPSIDAFDTNSPMEFSVPCVGGQATIRLFGADQIDEMRGLYFDGVVLDEPGIMERTAWTQVIRPALFDRNGWASFLGTPAGKNWFRDLYEEAAGNQQEWFVATIKASESGILTQEELADARAELPPKTYAQEMEAQFINVDVAPYALELHRLRTKVSELENLLKSIQTTIHAGLERLTAD